MIDLQVLNDLHDSGYNFIKVDNTNLLDDVVTIKVNGKMIAIDCSNNELRIFGFLDKLNIKDGVVMTDTSITIDCDKI